MNELTSPRQKIASAVWHIVTLSLLFAAAARSETISPNMNLPVPIVGVTTGPDYANDINACLLSIDGHNHTPGYGVPVPPAGLNINSDLTFQNHNSTNHRSVRFQAQGSPLSSGSDLGCLYESGADLYYNDGNGNQVRLTQSGGIAGTPGSIANLTSPASASYVAGSQTFVWQSASSTSADMDAGNVILREKVASAKGVTLSSPSSLAANYTVTFPASLPGSTSIMQVSAGGSVTASNTIANAVSLGSTLSVGSTLTVGSGGPTLSSCGSGNYLCSDKGSFYPNGTSYAALVNEGGTIKNTFSIQTGGGTGSEPRYGIVVGANSGSTPVPLMIVRGVLSITSNNSGFVTAASIVSGEGFSVSAPGGVPYVTVTFTNAFGDVPEINVAWESSAVGSTNFPIVWSTTTSSTAHPGLFQFPAGGGTINSRLHFSARGQRGN